MVFKNDGPAGRCVSCAIAHRSPGRVLLLATIVISLLLDREVSGNAVSVVGIAGGIERKNADPVVSGGECGVESPGSGVRVAGGKRRLKIGSGGSIAVGIDIRGA